MKRNLFAGRRRSSGIGLDVFTDHEVQDIHLATLEVLERTGVWVESDEALDIFSDGGCVVDRDSRIVRIPPHIVEDVIRSAPASIVLCGRDPANDIVIEAGRVGFSNFGEGVMVVDPYSGELRASTKQDLTDIAKLVYALPEVDVFEIAVGAGDMPPATAPVHNHEAAIAGQTKPISGGPLDGRAVRISLAMLEVDVCQDAGVTLFGPAVNIRTGKSCCWNTAYSLTVIKPCMEVARIPVHPNVGEGVCGVPVNGYPPEDAASRAARAFVDILRCDGL